MITVTHTAIIVNRRALNRGLVILGKALALFVGLASASVVVGVMATALLSLCNL